VAVSYYTQDNRSGGIILHTGRTAVAVSYCKIEDVPQWRYHTAKQRMYRSGGIILQHRGCTAVAVSYCNTEDVPQWRYHTAAHWTKRNCGITEHRRRAPVAVHNQYAIFLSAGLTAVNLAALKLTIRKGILIVNIYLQFLKSCVVEKDRP
jgi:predicted metal-binding protein